MSEFDERMALLRERFAARCGERHGQLAAVLHGRDAAAVVRIAHELAGTAGIFGYAQLSRMAQDLEEIARAGDGGGERLETRGNEVLGVLAELSGGAGR
jgi:HPt (histidine-containing phosphotransfer) domain-containing protein